MPAEASCGMANSVFLAIFIPPTWRTRSPDQPPVGPYGDGLALTKLLGSPLGMALGAEAAYVAVLVRSTSGQRYNVVRHGRLADNASQSAITAERLSP